MYFASVPNFYHTLHVQWVKRIPDSIWNSNATLLDPLPGTTNSHSEPGFKLWTWDPSRLNTCHLHSGSTSSLCTTPCSSQTLYPNSCRQRPARMGPSTQNPWRGGCKKSNRKMSFPENCQLFSPENNAHSLLWCNLVTNLNHCLATMPSV